MVLEVDRTIVSGWSANRTLLSWLRTGHRPDRTATAAPHAFGVDDTLHIRWQHNATLSGRIDCIQQRLHNAVNDRIGLEPGAA
jgi:hypothetical protein